LARSATPTLLRDLNERTVLEAIRAGAPISRAEISRRVGISKPTVSVTLESLLEAGLVREADNHRDGPKYGATFFEPVHEAALVLGLDVGARFLRGAICDLRGEVRARQDVEMPGADVHAVTAAAADLRDRLIAAAGVAAEALDCAVAGVPGVVEPGAGRIALAANIPGLEGLAFASLLERRLEVPVTVENDVNLAAVGEHRRGIGQGVEDFVFLSVGTGLGAGVVLKGELHRGHHGAAGEVDYAFGAEDVDEREDDPAGPGISAYATALVADGRLRTGLTPPYDARAIFGAARAGDELALAVVAEEARRIARHVVPIAAVVDVALVVLGGGIGANGDLLLAPIRELLAQRCPYPPRVEVSSLGDAAVLTGALAFGLQLALEGVFARRVRAARS
jgi:predicted NBD/HSP70 family sugar kinase